MAKFTRTMRDPGRTYIDENKVRLKAEVRSVITRFIKEGAPAEPKYIAALKIWFPGISEQEIGKRITLFRDAVREKG